MSEGSHAAPARMRVCVRARVMCLSATVGCEVVGCWAAQLLMYGPKKL